MPVRRRRLERDRRRPVHRTAPRLLAAVLGGLGLVLGVALGHWAGRVPRAVLHGVLAVATVAVSLCIARSTTPAGTVATSYSYLWIALYTAWFHPRRSALAHLTAIGAGFAVGPARRAGHDAGDDLLVELTRAWARTLRGSDVLGRHGGDEFIVLMPGTSTLEARDVLDRLAAASSACPWSAGVAEWRGGSLAQWVARADRDLYANKPRARS